MSLLQKENFGLPARKMSGGKPSFYQISHPNVKDGVIAYIFGDTVKHLPRTSRLPASSSGAGWPPTAWGGQVARGLAGKPTNEGF